MNHHDTETTGQSSNSIASNSNHETERSDRFQLILTTPMDLNEIYDSTMMVPPTRASYSKGNVSITKKSRGNRSSKRSSSRAAAREFAKQYLAAKRLSSTTSTTSSSAFLSTDSISEDFREAPDFGSEGPPSAFASSSKASWPASFEEDEYTSSSKLSVSEMKQMVMDSLPPEIKDRVPASAWKRIFCDDDTLMSDQSPIVRRLRGGSRDDVGDIVSVISNIVSRRSGGTCEVSTVSGLTRDDMNSSPTFQSPPERKEAAVESTPRPNVVSSVPVGSRVITDDVPTIISTTSSPANVTTSSSCPGNDKRKPQVCFDIVKIRSYGSILTINPSVTSGPAVGLGWEFDPEKDEKYALDDFERSKARSGPRRVSNQLLIGREARESLLLSLGYSQKEIAVAIRQTIRIKNQRKQTVQNLNMLPMEEILEKATRRVKRVLGFSNCPRNKSKYSPEFFQQQQAVVASGAA
ncbi:hypothetical protein IV203_034935 [Nitzschia inconspicua]|uniref:Uncharacterized protein n=1 Tax=Nitzschia inconspicua TaxID=303405 RepID=A0A9K3LCW8_9STRA|nr:hypothetical protein IV203_034935 [Nitzschia inconspicua]